MHNFFYAMLFYSSVTLMFSSKDARVRFLMLSMCYIMAPSSFPRHHSEKTTPIVSESMYIDQRIHFSFDNLGILFEVHSVCYCLSFSTTYLSAAFFSSIIYYRAVSMCHNRRSSVFTVIRTISLTHSSGVLALPTFHHLFLSLSIVIVSL